MRDDHPGDHDIVVAAMLVLQSCSSEAPGTTPPSRPGEPDSAVVGGFTFGVTHTFALRTADDSDKALSVAERIATLPSLKLTLAAAERLPENDRDGTRKLLEMLAQAIVLDFRERTVLIQWRLGGETRVPIPRLRGGPGRSVASMRRTALRQLLARP
jgi:hypothetical protein